MQKNRKRILKLELIQNTIKIVNRISLSILLLVVFPKCDDKEFERLYRDNVLITFYMGVLPGIIDNCPAAQFTVENGVDYPISLQKGNTSWFQFSPKGNVKPHEKSRNYFLTVTKDSSTSILLKAWTSCKNFSSPPRVGMTPHTETPTEVKFKIEYDSLQFPERNRYHLELTSENQTTVFIRQKTNII